MFLTDSTDKGAYLVTTSLYPRFMDVGGIELASYVSLSLSVSLNYVWIFDLKSKGDRDTGWGGHLFRRFCNMFYES